MAGQRPSEVDGDERWREVWSGGIREPVLAKELHERLDAIWAGIASPYGDDATQQEFLALLQILWNRSTDPDVWRTLSAWAAKRKEEL